MQSLHYRIPDQPTGYRLEPYGKGLWSVLEPVASTNLITNPSYEKALTGSVALSGSETLTRDNTKQRYGNWSLKVVTSTSSQRGMTLNNGGSGFSLTAGKTYTVSVEAWLAGGVPYRLYVTGPSSSTPGSLTITGQGRWMRYVLTFVPTATGGHNINFIKDASTSVVPWYLDGWQLEALPFATTYLDGDQRGYPEDYIDLNGLSKPSPYQWLGTPHASQSRRLETTRHGGREWTFDSLGLSVLAYTGAGISPMNVQDVSYYFGGGSFLRKTRTIRNLTIMVAIGASGLMSLDRQIAKAEQLFNNDDGHVTLQYQKSNLSPKIDIPVVYESGLESNRDNLYQERTALSFKHYLPIAERGNLSTQLNYSVDIPNANSIVMRETTGAWQSVGTGFSGTAGGGAGQSSINDVVRNVDGTYYFAGEFGTAGGTPIKGIAKWDGSTFTALSTGANNTVNDLALGPDGALYAGGNGGFGPSFISYLAKWDGTVWSSLGSVTGGQVRAVVFGPDGALYIGGDFTSVAGVANTARLAKYQGGAWSAVSSSTPNSTVRAIRIDNANNVYIGGSFTTIGGTSYNRLAVYDQTNATWSSLSTGVNDSVYALEFGPDNRLYIGGAFTDAGNAITVWNGSALQSLGTGVSYTSGTAIVQDIAIGADGRLYAAGQFNRIGSTALPDNMAEWFAGSWRPLDIDTPGASVSSITAFSDGRLFVGFFGGGTAKSAVTPVINYGPAEAYPLTTFYGPGQIFQLRNYTTDDVIYFSNLTLIDGEVATLDLSPGNVSFTSNLRGNLISYVASGSNLSTWALYPGSNNISSFMGGTTGANTAIYMQNSTSYNTATEAQ